MRSYPIWCTATNCDYKTDKSFGWKDNGLQTYNIGSSSRNSKEFLKTNITRRRKYDTKKEQYYWIFSFSIDDVILKQSYWTDKEGRPKDEYKVVTKLNSIKGLKDEL